MKLSKFKSHADTADITSIDNAYEVGSIATTRDGGVYTCDPAMASFGNKPFEMIWDAEICDMDRSDGSCTTHYRNVVEGCMNYAPTSERGASYWINNEESGNTVDTTNLTPQWIVACPFISPWMYIPGDFVVNAAGEIMECWDIQYCHADPDTTHGQKGWGATPFLAAGLDGYDASNCFNEYKYIDLSAPGYIAHAPYLLGDIIWDSSDIMVCQDTMACRLISDPDWRDNAVFDAGNDTDGIGYPESASSCGDGQAGMSCGTYTWYYASEAAYSAGYYRDAGLWGPYDNSFLDSDANGAQAFAWLIPSESGLTPFEAECFEVDPSVTYA